MFEAGIINRLALCEYSVSSVFSDLTSTPQYACSSAGAARSASRSRTRAGRAGGATRAGLAGRAGWTGRAGWQATSVHVMTIVALTLVAQTFRPAIAFTLP